MAQEDESEQPIVPDEEAKDEDDDMEAVEGILDGQGEDIDPDAIIEENDEDGVEEDKKDEEEKEE